MTARPGPVRAEPWLAAARARADRLPLAEIALAVLMAIGAAVILHYGRELTFFRDEWSFIVGRRGGPFDNLLIPHGEHFSLVPVAIYKTLFATFGLESYTPYRVVLVALHLVCVGLIFVLARRRVGDWLALALATAILFLGEGWEDLIWPFQIGFLSSLAAGLGALVALDRDDRVGDGLAAALLFVALAGSSTGIPFLFAAGVEVLWRADRWRRIWLVAAPAVLYGIWYLEYGVGALELRNAPDTPEYGATTLSAGIGGLTGLGLDFGRPLAIVAAGLVLWRLAAPERITPRTAAVVGGLLFFLTTLGLSRADQESPSASRYVYPAAVFVVLVAMELLRGRTLRPRVLGIVGVAVAVAAVSNVTPLRDASVERRGISDVLRARLGAVEIARDTVAPGYIADPDHSMITAARLKAAVDDIGSPSYSEVELARRSEPARAAADGVLSGALRIAAKPGAAAPAPSAAAPAVEAPPAGAVAPRGACVTFRPEAAATLDVMVPPGGIAVVNRGRRPAELRIRRFASAFPAEATPVPAGAAVTLAIPADRSRRPWHARISASGPVEACAAR